MEDFMSDYMTMEHKPVGQSTNDLERRRAAYERLKESFGTIHCEGNWKEELYEALDEKYNRAD
jgi:hypothetical protein